MLDLMDEISILFCYILQEYFFGCYAGSTTWTCFDVRGTPGTGCWREDSIRLMRIGFDFDDGDERGWRSGVSGVVLAREAGGEVR